MRGVNSGTRNEKYLIKPVGVDHLRAHFVFLDCVAMMRGSGINVIVVKIKDKFNEKKGKREDDDD